MWIRVDVAVPDHRKARRAARLIEAANLPPVPRHDPRLILGTLVLLWIRTRLEQPDGSLDGHGPEEIADLLGVSLPEAQALLEAGWLDPTEHGLEVHEWMAHNGDHLKEAKRKRDDRAAARLKAQPAEQSGPAGPASNLSVRHVTSRRADVRENARTSTGRPPDAEAITGPPASPAPPAGAAPADSGASDAPAGRCALFRALGVPEGEWDLIDAHLGLLGEDEGPEASRARAEVARLSPTERHARLAPALEGNRQRVLALLGTVRGGTPAAPASSPRVDVARIAEMAAAHGREGQGKAIALAHWLAGRGIAHAGLLERFVLHFVEHFHAIRNPHAYFNPGREGFEAMRMRCAADMATEEHEALLEAERAWLPKAAGR